MRKRFYLLFCLLLSVSTWADNRVIDIKGETIPKTGNTEVSINSDGIVVSPAIGVTVIKVLVADVMGKVLSEQVLPAQSNVTVSISTPPVKEGYTLELYDDNGLIYSESDPLKLNIS